MATMPDAHPLHARALCSTHIMHYASWCMFTALPVPHWQTSAACYVIDCCRPDATSAVAVHLCVKTCCQLVIIDLCCQLQCAHICQHEVFSQVLVFSWICATNAHTRAWSRCCGYGAGDIVRQPECEDDANSDQS